MKVFISADIEGVTGVTHWDETNLEKPESARACEQMTAETAAACAGALEAGATEIWVKDAHDKARNLDAAKLPREVRLIRGWAPNPLMMMQELDETFQAAMLIGYHSRASANSSPLSHSMTGAWLRIRINGREMSECALNSYAAALFNVPVVFVSGDRGLCEEARSLIPRVTAVAVKEGIGDSTVSIHPELAIARIREGAAGALKGEPMECLLKLPEHFSVEIEFKEHTRAYVVSFYPGAKLADSISVQFESRDYYEVLRFLFFAA